ncbi:hypothetical protein EDD16DRAFT_1519266 [Pisolithus croceorrhizus]|nr:hypothetical protein EDD16DRAFT_1519266 [Pisolithus croceorrhizus]KAI6134586.1 hypothetical protein EV401DRAFT_1882383 [Pisolithus croceorrhizus]KAI6166117.1 hypothetical protein EDD17DRAFT_1505558 [Pisolithus thermaeus]
MPRVASFIKRNCPGYFQGTTGISSELLDICDQYEDISFKDYIYIADRLERVGYAKPWKSILVEGLCATLVSLPVSRTTVTYASKCKAVLASCLDHFGLWRVHLRKLHAYVSDNPDLLVVGKRDPDVFSRVVVDGHTWFSLSSVEIYVWTRQPGDTRIILDYQESDGYAFGTFYPTVHLDGINRVSWRGLGLLKDTIICELGKISDVEQATIRSMENWSPPSQLLDPTLLRSKLKKKPYNAT